MRQDLGMSAETPIALVDTLSFYAGEVAMENPGNFQYALSVFRRAADVETMLITNTGEVRSVITSWMDDAQPLLEAVFGRSLEGEKLGALQDYEPTVLSGIYGRTRIVSTDEIFGPCITLDLAAESAINSGE